MANIILRLSTGDASVSSVTNPNASLGGQMGINDEAKILTSNNTLNNLFDDVTKAENFAGTTDYRCVYVHNDTASVGQLFANSEVYLTGSSYADIQIGVEPAGKSVVTTTIATENDAPSGISFSSPSESVPLTLSSAQIDPTEWVALWIKRTASNISGTGTVTDTISLSVRGVE
jgi:hypothetical protein